MWPQKGQASGEAGPRRAPAGATGASHGGAGQRADGERRGALDPADLLRRRRGHRRGRSLHRSRRCDGRGSPLPVQDHYAARTAGSAPAATSAPWACWAIAPRICGQAARGRSWPIPGIVIRRAPLIALAVARPPEGETSRSASPWMTSVGAGRRAARGGGHRWRRSRRAGGRCRPGWGRGRSSARSSRAARSRRARSRASRSSPTS